MKQSDNMTAIPPDFQGIDPALFDTAQWPLIFGRFPELHEPDRVTRILHSLDAILRLQQPFVMAWIPPSHDHDDEPHEDEKRSVVWIKQQKAQLRRYCKGYLYITQDPELHALLEGRLNQVRKMYGFPMQIVATKANAIEQARALMVPTT